MALRRTAMRRTEMRRGPADNHLSRDEWRIVRHNLAVRSGHCCEQCGGSVWGLSDNEVEVQHRRAQGMGGTDLGEANSLANLLLFHARCHRWVESRPVQRFVIDGEPVDIDVAKIRGLWVPHTTDDGEPVPVETYPLVLFSGRQVFLDPVSAPYVKHPDEYGFPGPLVVHGR
jgi:hypothetical protein